MTDEKRCEPPPEWRDRDGEHHIYCHPAGTNVRGNPVVVRWGARAQGWWADHLDLRGHNAAEAASMGWRYIASVTPPATVAALVEALEGMMNLDTRQEVINEPPEADDIRAAAQQALALYRGEAGR